MNTKNDKDEVKRLALAYDHWINNPNEAIKDIAFNFTVPIEKFRFYISDKLKQRNVSPDALVSKIFQHRPFGIPKTKETIQEFAESVWRNAHLSLIHEIKCTCAQIDVDNNTTSPHCTRHELEARTFKSYFDVYTKSLIQSEQTDPL